MRRKLCFGLLLVCSIIVGSLLNVCLDVNAITYTADLNYIDTLNSSWTKQARLNNGAWSDIGRSDPMLVGDSTSLYTSYIGQITTVNSFDITKDHLYEITATVWTRSDDPSPIGFLHEVKDSANFSVVSFDLVGDDTATLDYWRNCSYTDSNGVGRTYQCYLTIYPNQSKTYRFLIKAKKSGNFPVSLGNPSTALFEYEHASATVSNPSIYFVPVSYVYEFEYNSIGETVEDMNDKDNQDRSDLSNQSSDIDSDASDSSSDAETQGTTLLGAFSAFVTALTSASPSNCVIDMDLGNLDMGNVDFCTLSPPQPIPTIASIFLILFCVPLSIATAKKVINLFRSFQ